MSYTAVIRTLGKAGEKYQQLLNSICAQTVQPRSIIVYLAEGYTRPKETCGREQIVYVSKGMVAQRALPYHEVETEWILFLDDDLYLPPGFVETLFASLIENDADIVSPNIFDHASRSLGSELLMTFSGRMRARRGDRSNGYKVMPTCGFSYNKNPERGQTYWSQTNAGACFLCRKSDFLRIRFEDELWLDRTGYAIGDDQVMFYKMYLMGLKQLTLFGSGIEHLDAGANLGNRDKVKKIIEGDYFFRYVFWHRFIQGPEKNLLKRFWNRLCITYFYGFGLLLSLLKGKKDIFQVKINGIKRGQNFVNSSEYSVLHPINKNVNE